MSLSPLSAPACRRLLLRALVPAVLLCTAAAPGGAGAQTPPEPEPVPDLWQALGGGPELALQALSFLGVPYRYASQDPARGFDCSGLVRYVTRAALGLDLPRSAQAMASVGQRVTRDALRVGDLLFFNTLGRRNSHVGIYIGDGRFVHAPARGGVVRVEEIDASYWRKRFNGARRLMDAAVVPSGAADADAAAVPDAAGA